MSMHQAIATEISMLKARFPEKEELLLDDYADYFGISRQYASQHFSRMNAGKKKIAHKRIGKTIIIPIIDFAYWLAQQKVIDGRPVAFTEADMKRRRGFCQS